MRLRRVGFEYAAVADIQGGLSTSHALSMRVLTVSERVVSTRVLQYTCTHQLTVNNCFDNASDVLKPPRMATAAAYSNPTRKRPIDVAYTAWTILYSSTHS